MHLMMKSFLSKIVALYEDVERLERTVYYNQWSRHVMN